MTRDDTDISPRIGMAILGLSILLLFFTVPHVLEDFTEGEPLKKGIPAPVLSMVVALLLSAQMLGLYWLGQGRRRALIVHAVLGLLWPLAAGVAQLSEVLGDAPYRSGAISVAYVLGIIVIGPALLVCAVFGLRR